MQHGNKLQEYKFVDDNFVQGQWEHSLESDDAKLVGISNGVASVANSKCVKLFDLQSRFNKNSAQKEEVKQALTDESEVLKMQIDTSKITVDEIDKYERMMYGNGAKGKSNTNWRNEVRHCWQAMDT
jgi:hypothetical protein